ncbi:hypothetical protein KKD62_01555 [Patescibacteria group bacterium]|nr:hypothetical protein [Patescibacteria group bacterium]MBU1931408.1 hypothetical protein [Patescibacteria group bacterium]
MNSADFKAFQLRKNGQLLDYRLGKNLNFKPIATFFSAKGYQIQSLNYPGRHVAGILTKDGQKYFLKLATTPGISVLTEIEADWNQQFNQLIPRKESLFWVPQVFDQGYYQTSLFYLITDVFSGPLLASVRSKNVFAKLMAKNLSPIIKFSQLIANLNLKNIVSREDIQAADHQQWFMAKTQSWYKAIPISIIEKYPLEPLLVLVKQNSSLLAKKTRHGDFAPWHIFQLPNNRLGLIDAEHALSNGVEYYDIGYFIQRVFSVLEKPDLAEKIINILLKLGYSRKKLKTILSARAIGGFLDSSLVPFPDYTYCQKFADLTLNL